MLGHLNYFVYQNISRVIGDDTATVLSFEYRAQGNAGNNKPRRGKFIFYRVLRLFQILIECNVTECKPKSCLRVSQ